MSTTQFGNNVSISLDTFRRIRFPDETEETLTIATLKRWCARGLPGAYRVPPSKRWRIRLDIYDEAIEVEIAKTGMRKKLGSFQSTIDSVTSGM